MMQNQMRNIGHRLKVQIMEQVFTWKLKNDLKIKSIIDNYGKLAAHKDFLIWSFQGKY